MKEQKPTFIKIEVDPKLKSDFQAKCKKKSINMSLWFRNQMQKVIDED